MSSHLSEKPSPDKPSPTKREAPGHRDLASKALLLGLGDPGTTTSLRKSLGLDENISDANLAVHLARLISEDDLKDLRVPDNLEAIEGVFREERAHEQDRRKNAKGLEIVPSADGSEDLSHIDDLRTLTTLVRGGNLWQRRAAVLRLGERLTEPKPGKSEDVKEATELILKGRSVDTAYERVLVGAEISKSAGKELRAEKDQWTRLVTQIEKEIKHFWDGVHAKEPISSLPSDQRAQLLLRARELPDSIIRHLGAVIEMRMDHESRSEDGANQEDVPMLLLSSLRFAGDPRLVPSLSVILEAPELDLRMEACRALARIADPRVVHVLRGAFERAVVDSERVVLAGALGAFGDCRGAEYVRFQANDADEQMRRVVLEALETLGEQRDIDGVLAMLQGGDSATTARALRTLACIGDRRVLPVLARLRDRTNVSGLYAEISHAFASIRARMELHGEEAAERPDISIVEPMMFERERSRSSAPFVTRVRSRWSYFLGYVWLAIGATQAALRRFETAATLRRGWLPPTLTMAVIFSRRKRDALALAEFRRAVEVNRPGLESHTLGMRMMARTFLRRAEAVERQGRREIALSLLEEILALDLAYVPSALRFELERRHSALRRSLGEGLGESQ